MLGRKSGQSMLGIALREVMAKFDIYDTHQKMFPKTSLPGIRALKGAPSPQETLLCVNRKTGKKSWLTIKARPVYNQQKKIQFAVVILDDVTSQKFEEKQKEMFTGIASHELKNTLSGIKVFSQLIKKHFQKYQDQKAEGYLNKINSRTDKLTKLINDLLDSSKISAGKLNFIDEVFDFDDLIKEIIDETQSIIKQKLEVKGKIGKLMIADKNRISQVLINLLTNAGKYSPEKSKIQINLRLNKNLAWVSVTDSGVGIEPEKQKQIFEPFFRVENPSYNATGLGLGLYISSEIIKHYGGKIWVKSNPGKGSTFHFTLPLKGKLVVF